MGTSSTVETKQVANLSTPGTSKVVPSAEGSVVPSSFNETETAERQILSRGRPSRVRPSSLPLQINVNVFERNLNSFIRVLGSLGQLKRKASEIFAD